MSESPTIRERSVNGAPLERSRWRGVPLSLVVSGANVHDVKLLAATLDQVVRARPAPRSRKPQRLC
ncbi:MAG: IS5/IS1182 family transposase, partial [Terriglobia bacterium]